MPDSDRSGTANDGDEPRGSDGETGGKAVLSRSVFNEAASDRAFQAQAKERAADRWEGKEWWPDDPDLGSARVEETSRDVAEKIILEYEWLGTLPAIARRFYGIFFGEGNWACGGVACFADGGAGINQAKMFGVERDELAYLVRGANTHWSPPNSGSKLISYALDFEADRGKKVAVAYSDLDAGEIGTVYQATNWYCLGRGQSITLLIHPETGRPYNVKLVDSLLRRENLKEQGWTFSDMRDYLVHEKGWETAKSKPKYRYAKILTDDPEEKRRIYAKIEDDITGYPKRERDVVEDDGDDGAGAGGGEGE